MTRALYIGVSGPISPYELIGLPLIYASAYFLPALGAAGSYLLPSYELIRLILLPTSVAVLAGVALICASFTVIRYWCNPRVAKVCLVLALSGLALIGLKGIMVAAGYDWEEHVPRGPDLVTTLRYIKYFAFLVLVALVFLARGVLARVARMLSSLGIAFGFLAVFRIVNLWSGPSPIPAALAEKSPLIIQSMHFKTELSDGTAPITDSRSRRVVWIIFDETDFNRVYGEKYPGRPDMKNFDLLAGMAVFAANANSPASATLYSIPALLSGVPLAGAGVKIDRSGALWLDSSDSGSVPFGEATSIFGALSASGRSASVLGFYHPYCKLFVLERCDSAPWPDVGGLDAALWANIPEVVADKFRRSGTWEQITKKTLALLPEYLARDDALTFAHINVPHLPSRYAESVLNLPRSSDPLTEYSYNLLLADKILGEVMSELRGQALRHDILLVVSTDHWLRNRSIHVNTLETSRPIPLIVWKVGDTNGFVLTKPVSTVHTGAMILEYLRGHLSTQADVAHWWETQTIYPSFIVPNT